VAERFVIGQGGTSGRSRKHWFHSGCSRKLVGELTPCRDKGERGDESYCKNKAKKEIKYKQNEKKVGESLESNLVCLVKEKRIVW
jgi:hypothetical protein